DLGFASFKKQGDWGMQSPKVLTLLFVQARVHRPHLNVVVPNRQYDLQKKMIRDQFMIESFIIIC
ncbi:MAG: hypothetical protein H7832_03175, partial [Magnetococcus sp. DMHC-6]